MTRQIFDRHATTYSEDIDQTLGKYGASHDFFTAHKAWLIGHLLEREGLNGAEMDLLDVGCGVGKIHAHLAPIFRSVTGTDVSPESLAVARATYPGLSYVAYDGERLPYDDRSFDLTMAICVFHHVPPAGWQGLADEMLRVLRPGGMSLVIEHNPFNPVTRRIVSTCPLDKDAVLLRPARLRALFDAAAGATVARTRSIVSVPPVSPLMKRVDAALGRLPFGAQYYLLARTDQRAA